jgi:Multidrug resistance efflux pump
MKLYIKAVLLAAVGGLSLASCHKEEKTSPIMRHIEEAVFANGAVTQRNEYIASANVDGFINDIPITEGSIVHNGDLLFTIKSDATENQLHESQIVYDDAARNNSPSAPQLSQIHIQINYAREKVNFDKKNLDRYKALKMTNAVSEADLEEKEISYKNSLSNLKALERSYKQTADELRLNARKSKSQVMNQLINKGYFSIKADKDGTVLNVFKKKGELVKTGDRIAQIASGETYLKLYVAEEDIENIRCGQQAKVQINTYPGKIFDATVTRILPAFDDSQQSFVIEVKLNDSNVHLFSGSQVQANIVISKRKYALVIPSSYLMKEAYVMLQNGIQRHIVVGNKNREWTEVLSGLSKNDVIVMAK